MKELPIIQATYRKLAEIFDREIEAAERLQDYQAADSVRLKRQVNVWGQIEAKINEIAERAIMKRQADPRWEYRRAWDGLNSADVRRIRLVDRLAIVLDRQAGRGSSFSSAIRLYDERNRVAHGASLAQEIDVPAIIAQACQFESEMRD